MVVIKCISIYIICINISTYIHWYALHTIIGILAFHTYAMNPLWYVFHSFWYEYHTSVLTVYRSGSHVLSIFWLWFYSLGLVRVWVSIRVRVRLGIAFGLGLG